MTTFPGDENLHDRRESVIDIVASWSLNGVDPTPEALGRSRRRAWKNPSASWDISYLAV